MLYFNNSRREDSRNVLSYKYTIHFSSNVSRMSGSAYASEHIIITCKRWVEARLSMERLLRKYLPNRGSYLWTCYGGLLKEDLPTNLHLRNIILTKSLLDKLYHMAEDIMSEKKDLQEKQQHMVLSYAGRWTKILYYFKLFYVYIGNLDVGSGHHAHIMLYIICTNVFVWWFCIIFL